MRFFSNFVCRCEVKQTTSCQQTVMTCVKRGMWPLIINCSTKENMRGPKPTLNFCMLVTGNTGTPYYMASQLDSWTAGKDTQKTKHDSQTHTKEKPL